MDPLLQKALRELVAGDAIDDELNSKTAFQLGTPTLSMPSYSAPQLTYTPTPAAAPEQYGPPLSAMAAPAPSTAAKLASAASAYAPQALAALQKRGKPGAPAAVPGPPPSFLMSPAFGGMNWLTVIGAGSAIFLTTVGTILLARNASHSGRGRRR